MRRFELKFKVTLFAATAILAGLPAAASGAASTQKADLLIAGGTVYRGDLGEPEVVDVAIRDDRIIFVGDAAKAGIGAKRVIAARSMMVTPGFIDPHTHVDDELVAPDAADRLVRRQVAQGVTTSIIGVDGSGSPDIAAAFARFEKAGIGQNIAAYAGFGAIRTQIIGEGSRAPTADELAAMKALMARAMCEGALGLSSGLFYAPQSYASADEVIAVAKEAGLRGGRYDTHQRDEGDSNIGVLASLGEAIRIGRESGAPLNLAHIKVTKGSQSDHRTMQAMIAMIEEAQAAGQPVTADQYPWIAANTGLDAAVIPRWAQDGGREAMLKRFADPADAARIEADSRLTPALAETIMLNGAPGQSELVGKRLSDLAKQWGVTPTRAAMRALAGGPVSVAVFVMSEDDVREAMVLPWVMTSSDGRKGGHPRAFASYPKLWVDYVTGQKLLTPVQFVHRSSGFVADTLGLVDRGYLRPGYFADVVVIDPARYAPRATFVEPQRLAEGVVSVIVNGQVELDNGKPTGILAGRGLVHPAKAGTCP